MNNDATQSNNYTSINKDNESRSPQNLLYLKEKNIPIPPPCHPRLMVNQADLPGLLAKRQSHDLSRWWKQIQKSLKIRVEKAFLTQNGEDNFDWRVLISIESRALMYLLEGDKVMGQEAVKMAKAFMQSFHTTKPGDYWGGGEAGQTMMMGAMVYDWCFDLLTDEDKKTIIAQHKRLYPMLEFGHRFETLGYIQFSSIAGHETENSFSRDMLAAGIATFDEDDTLYKIAADIVCNQFVPWCNWFYQAGMHHQGSTYGLMRAQYDAFINTFFRAMGYGDIIGADMKGTFYRPLYARRPDQYLMLDGDTYGITSNTCTRGAMMHAGYFKDPYLKWEFWKEWFTNSWQIDPVITFLMIPGDEIPAKKPTDLPLTRYFPSPQGVMIARTGWDTKKQNLKSRTAICQMKVREYAFFNHSHMDSGSFQLYYKGALTNDSGVFGAWDDMGDRVHTVNYYSKGIAKNMMLFVDPSIEPYDTAPGQPWNMRMYHTGGLESPKKDSAIKTMEEFFALETRWAKVLAHYSGNGQKSPNFSHLKGDFASGYGDRCHQYTRSFVFLNMKNKNIPGVLIVLDKTIAPAHIEKYWTLHTIEEPVLSGRRMTTIRTDEYEGGQYNGKLVLDMLLPKSDYKMSAIGGPGHEFEGFGHNFSTKTPPHKESGAWRLRISPEDQKRKENVFLNVMQVMDAHPSPTPYTPDFIETDEFYGVVVGNRMVIFSKNFELLEKSFSFDVSPQRTVVLATDLSPGIWVLRNVTGRKLKTFVVDEASRCVEFACAGGKYWLSKE